MSEPMESIQERWRIDLLREVARGGMSVIYEGRLNGADGFAKTVAVKMVLEKWSENSRFMQLCAAEAKLVSDLVHENIVQILQLGRTADGQYYVVMEYVDGLPLRRLLDHHRLRRKRLPVPLAVHIASRVARGLSYAHTFHDESGRCLEIVHRDVCPSNILITKEGLAKLTDFGVAKAVSMTLIGDGILTGKVSYMAPEQADCRPVDFRADQFALGAVLFEMLAGSMLRPAVLDPRKTPFAALEIPWHCLPPELDPTLIDLLKRCLAPDPAARYEKTAELATMLEWIIYKDGYGPTIQTVEAYLRKEMPSLYQPVHTPAAVADSSAETVVET
ncbi:MAG: serine/threonine-protein kinase [Kiritimatiellia bacterium]